MVSVFRSTDVLLIVGQVIYYSIKFIRIPNKYQRELNEEYSNVENFSINWLKWFNASFVLIGLLSISFYMFNPFREKNDFFLILFLFSVSAFIWILGIWSFKQKKPKITFVSIPEIHTEELDSLKIKEDELVKSLMAYFEKEKPYLQPDLTLTTASKVIGTNRTYLSAVINSNFGVNFNVFVNQFRICYVEDYLKQHPKTSKDELVNVGGFGSVSSLKRALNKQKLTTDSESETPS
jgi:AraC-like DNA-binding protein